MKKKIRTIVFLMCLALVFVIGFQVYWIHQTYRVNQQQLERDINRVLTVASERFLGQRAITFFSSINTEGSTIEKVIVKPYLWTEEDTLLEKQRSLPKIREVQSSITLKADSISVISTDGFPSSVNMDSNHINLVYQSKNKSTFTDIIAKKRVPSTSNHNFSIKTYFEVDSLDSTRHSKPTAIESLIHSYTGDNNEALNLMLVPNTDYLLLDSVIRAEFDALPLDIPFQYGVRNITKNDFVYLSDSLNREAIVATVYKKPLASPFSNEKTELLLYIENHNLLLLKKMMLPLLTSFMLVALVLVSLGYSLKTILGQKRLSEIKNDFINNMTHEFKTPISTISLALEAIVHFDVQKDADKMDKYLGISRHQTHRLGMMVEKVLRIATSEKTDLKLNLEKVDVHELIEKVKESIEVQVKEKGGEVLIVRNAQKIELQADPIHLSNVLYNLIDNANKYSPEKPKITISTKKADNYFKIDVTDNGIGIPKQHRKHIFDKFYRVPTGNIHNVKGFGLGLCYVAMIVNQHEGKVEFQSEVDKGSTFSIMLPYQN